MRLPMWRSNSMAVSRISAPGDCRLSWKRVLDEISFEAPDKSGSEFVIDADYVRKHVGDSRQGCRSVTLHFCDFYASVSVRRH